MAVLRLRVPAHLFQANYQIPVETKTPSFPSGHTAQSILVAKIIGDVYPQLKEDAMKIADDVSKSRIVGGHHFKSDIEFGEKIGMWLYNN